MILLYLLAFDAPVRGGGSPSEYCDPVWYGIKTVARLPDGEKTLRICITVYTEYQRVTDGQIDGQTDKQTISTA